MHQFFVKALLLSLLFVSVVELTTGETVHVKPTDYDSQCTESCTTLSNYVSRNNGSVHSSVAFVFLEGHHVLESNLIVFDSENVSLTAFSNANVTIDCGESSRLIFDRVTNLVIENIKFLSCGIPDLQPGILVQNISNGRLENMNVSKSKATALCIQTSAIEIINLMLTHNSLINSSHPFPILLIVNDCEIRIKRNFTIARNNVTFLQQNHESCSPESIEKSRLTSTPCIAKVNSSVVLADAQIQVAYNVCPNGIIRFENSNFTWSGQGDLNHNFACVNGVMSFLNTAFRGTGDIDLFANKASNNYYFSLGVVSVASFYVRDSVLEMFGNLTFCNNMGDVTAIECFNSIIIITGQLRLENTVNKDFAYSGINLRAGSLMNVTGRTIFRNNYVYNSVIRLESSNMSMYDLSEFTSNFGAPTFTPRYKSFLKFIGCTTFKNNSGILFGIDSTITFDGNSTFMKNHFKQRYNEGGLSLFGSLLYMKGQYSFVKNKVNGLYGGVISSLESRLTFEGQGRFSENHAKKGGVIYLQDFPKIFIESRTELLFEGNSAQQGAVLYVSGAIQDILCNDSSSFSLCFFEVKESFNLTFISNKAIKGGSLLHINLIEDFDVLNASINTTSFNILTKSDKNNSHPLIAADPFQLCFCDNNTPVCNNTSIERTVRRGELFTVSVAALQLFENNLPRKVTSKFNSTTGDTKSLNDDKSQNISTSCKELEYRVYTTAAAGEVVIAAACDKQCKKPAHRLTFKVTLADCLMGFSLESDHCTCDKRLKQFHQKSNWCSENSTNLSKERVNFWMGVYLDESGSYRGLILYHLCPFNYCIPPSVLVEVDLTDPDMQCNNHRSGILCGQCKAGKSLILGDPECSECSSTFLLLIIPMALLGVALVGFLFLTKLTVTSGVVNGFTLYANILSTNEVAFDLRKVYGLRVFIAWVNLDFGIPTCFHNGMTHLTYTAWQFAFPLYLWLLVAFIIILCHYSIRASKFFGKTDPVAVLATLVLLSYNKLLRNILTILTPATLEYPPESNIHSIVWLYDGNVGFAQGGHAVLVFVALASLIFLFLPFTLVLMFAQFLQKSDRISRCFNKLNLLHAIKSYQVPYKPASRYWIGLCLLLRGIVQITLLSTSSDNSSAHLLAVSTISIVLISIIGAAGGIYSNRWLDVLEISFILNLGVLSAVAYHIELVNGNQETATYASTSIAFVTFIGVVLFTVYQRLVKFGYLKPFGNIFNITVKTNSNSNEFVVKDGARQTNTVSTQDVFISSSDKDVALREVLLETNY